MNLEREVKKLEKQFKADEARMSRDIQQIQHGVEQALIVHGSELVLAISMGISIARNENGLTLAEKISAADFVQDTQPNAMQKALLQQLGWNDIPSSLTRAELSYEIVKRVGKEHLKFLARLDGSFQDRFCGGPLSRFQVSITASVAKVASFIWTSIKVVVGLAVIVVALSIVAVIFLMIFGPRK